MADVSSARGVQNATLTDPATNYAVSARGVQNATLTDPVGSPTHDPSPRATVDVALIDPAGPSGYGPSSRGTANAILAPLVSVPDGWAEITLAQRVGAVWKPIALTQSTGQPLRLLQYVGVVQPPVDPGSYTVSARGTATVSLVGSWVKPVMGLSAADDAAFAAIDSQVGPVLARRTYDTALPASWAASTAASDVAAGRMSYWSWKPSMNFPTDTAAQTAFSDFLDTIPSGHRAVIMAWSQPETDITSGAYTLAQWGAVQTAFMTIVKAKSRPELRTAFCTMGPWTWDTRSGRVGWDWEGVMNFALIDVFGMNPYRPGGGSTISLETMLTVQNTGTNTGPAGTLSMMQVIQGWGKPASIMEWGAYQSTDTQMAAYITSAFAWLKSWNQAHLVTPIESAMWFNNTGGLGSPLIGAAIPAYAATVTDSVVTGVTPIPFTIPTVIGV